MNPEQLLSHKNELEKNPRFLYSYPDWLWEHNIHELGSEKWEKEAAAMHEQASVYLRVNTLKTNKQDLIKAFASERNGLSEVPEIDSALKLEKRENVFQHKRFK